jgi:hypothetical protein
MPASPTDSPRSSDSTESKEIEIEFLNPRQVEELYGILVDKHNNLQDEIEAIQMLDDDVQELREQKLNQYEYAMMAEVYEALGQKTVANGLREQAEECEERIKELEESLEEDLPDIQGHMMTMLELEIKNETIEVQMKACQKYLERTKRKAYMEAKKATIKVASPRRYKTGAASPSRLNTEFGREGASLGRTSPKRSPKLSSSIPAPISVSGGRSSSILPLPLPLPQRKN